MRSFATIENNAVAGSASSKTRRAAEAIKRVIPYTMTSSKVYLFYTGC